MKTAYSYSRFSTREQRFGDSLRRQMAASRKWCEKNGYKLSDESFVDEGKSAHKGEHLGAKGELARMLAKVDDGTIPRGSVILLESFDRLSRLKPTESIELFLRFINKGVGLVFTMSWEKSIIDLNRVNNDPNCLTMIIGECLRAYNESKIKGERVSESKQASLAEIRKGRIVRWGTIPNYFRWDKDRETYVHDEAKVSVIRSLAAKYIAGASLYSLACGLNASKTPTFRYGNEWSPAAVKAVLRNKTLIGYFKGNPNYLPRILCEEDFNNIQVLFKRNTTSRGQVGDVLNIFRGIARCSSCSGTMHLTVTKLNYLTKEPYPKPYRYLRCAKISQGKTCEARHAVHMEDVEDAFFIDFLRKAPKTLLEPGQNGKRKQLRSAIESKQAEENRLSAEITKLADTAQSLGIDDFKTQIAKLVSQRNAIKDDIARLSTELREEDVALPHFNELDAIIRRFWSADGNEDDLDAMLSGIHTALADNEVRRKIRTLLPSIVGKIAVDGENNSFAVYNHSGNRIWESGILSLSTP